MYEKSKEEFQEGIGVGEKSGRKKKNIDTIICLYKMGKTPKEIAEFCNCEVEEIEEIQRNYRKGIALGEAKIGKLFNALLQNNRIEDVKKACNDSKIRKQLYKEFNIE